MKATAEQIGCLFGVIAIPLFIFIAVLYGPVEALFAIAFLLVILFNLDFDNETKGSSGNDAGDFMNVLLILSASIIKSDNKVCSTEIEYVHSFFKREFGEEKMNEYIVSLQQILEKDYDLRTICLQSRRYMPMAYRLQLLHYLFGLAHTDGPVGVEEASSIYTIAGYLQISSTDYYSIKAMYEERTSYNSSTTTGSYVTDDTNYTILGITRSATDAQVKEAYRQMAVKFHPDKVCHLGEDIQRAANEKFQRINAAYKQIKKERGIK